MDAVPPSSRRSPGGGDRDEPVAIAFTPQAADEDAPAVVVEADGTDLRRAHRHRPATWTSGSGSTPPSVGASPSSA